MKNTEYNNIKKIKNSLVKVFPSVNVIDELGRENKYRIVKNKSGKETFEPYTPITFKLKYFNYFFSLISIDIDYYNPDLIELFKKWLDNLTRSNNLKEKYNIGKLTDISGLAKIGLNIFNKYEDIIENSDEKDSFNFLKNIRDVEEHNSDLYNRNVKLIQHKIDLEKKNEDLEIDLKNSKGEIAEVEYIFKKIRNEGKARGIYQELFNYTPYIIETYLNEYSYTKKSKRHTASIVAEIICGLIKENTGFKLNQETVRSELTKAGFSTQNIKKMIVKKSV